MKEDGMNQPIINDTNTHRMYVLLPRGWSGGEKYPAARPVNPSTTAINPGPTSGKIKSRGGEG